jgi:hypothetical protein
MPHSANGCSISGGVTNAMPRKRAFSRTNGQREAGTAKPIAEGVPLPKSNNWGYQNPITLMITRQPIRCRKDDAGLEGPADFRIQKEQELRT